MKIEARRQTQLLVFWIFYQKNTSLSSPTSSIVGLQRRDLHLKKEGICTRLAKATGVLLGRRRRGKRGKTVGTMEIFKGLKWLLTWHGG